MTEVRTGMLGDFMVAFVKARAELQDEIIFNSVAILSRDKEQNIDPYPVLTHIYNLMKESGKIDELESHAKLKKAK